MNLVIDANVFKAFYEEEVLNHPSPRPGRTGSPLPIFNKLGKATFSYIDSDKQLEFEWRNMCKGGEEWFESWLANAFVMGGVSPIEVKKINEKCYRDAGFPSKGRDIWYIRVATSLAAACSANDAYLVSEDIDFYAPTLKKNANRSTHIEESKGPIAKQLKKDRVIACCIKHCVEQLP